MYLLHKILVPTCHFTRRSSICSGEAWSVWEVMCWLESYITTKLLFSHQLIRLIMLSMSGGVLLVASFCPLPLMSKGGRGLGVLHEVDIKSKVGYCCIMVNVLSLMSTACFCHTLLSYYFTLWLNEKLMCLARSWMENVLNDCKGIKRNMMVIEEIQ